MSLLYDVSLEFLDLSVLNNSKGEVNGNLIWENIIYFGKIGQCKDVRTSKKYLGFIFLSVNRNPETQK